MLYRSVLLASLMVAGVSAANAQAPTPVPVADYLFVGSYHMNNPGRDAHNTRADDVRLPKRQAEIREVVEALKRYRPTRIMIEQDAGAQARIDVLFAETCSGKRPYGRGEEEQIGLRIACELKLGPPVAVDWSEMGPIKDEASINYIKAAEKYGQQAQRAESFKAGEAWNQRQQSVLDNGTVGDVLRYLNAPQWRAENARAYFRIAQYGTPADPVGANWEALWYLRNRMISNNIRRATREGDRVLVLYGAGHGNWLVQQAAESGVYRMHAAADYLGTGVPPGKTD